MPASEPPQYLVLLSNGIANRDRYATETGSDTTACMTMRTKSRRSHRPQHEPGLRVQVSEDGSQVLLVLDPDRARELAAIISTLSISTGCDDAWTTLSSDTTDEPWLAAMLHLISCSQNVRR